MKQKLVSVLLAVAMTASSLSVASAASLETTAETYAEETIQTETAETETETSETQATETETEAEETQAPETETQTETSPETPKPETEPESVQETEAQTETEAAQKQVILKTEKADIFFASDLKKLKDGTLEDPDLKKDPVPQTEADTQEKQEKRAAAIKEAVKVLPDEYVPLLTDDAYKLLMKQEHKFDISAPVDFYVVPEEGYQVDSVKVDSTLYGELQVTDFENGAYEVTIPSDDVTLNVLTKEVQDETETETEKPKETETETAKEEHFLEKADGVDALDASQFTSQRLVVLASDSSTVVDTEHLIGQYDNIYLLQYSSVEQTMNAYVYYLDKAEAVEPDTVITAASDETESEAVLESETETQPETETDTSAKEETEAQTETEVQTVVPSDVTATEIDNPITTLAGEQDSAVVQAESKVVALLDTGAEGPNIIDQVSMIDGGLVGTSNHASDMVDAITEQNPNAKILSVRVLGDDNLGTISSIVAGMEYAISQNVDFINLSLYARKSLSNSVLASEIQKAKDAGIEVVGAAGNDGADVINYMPGSVESAWIIGACDEEGNRIESSNYGATVDYNVVGDSTSVSTARFTGYISKNGAENISSDIIFTANGESTDKEEVSDKEEMFEGAEYTGTALNWGSSSVDYNTSSTSFSSYNCSSIEITGNSKPVKKSSDGSDMYYGTNMDLKLYNAGYTVDSSGNRIPMNVRIHGESSKGFVFNTSGGYASIKGAAAYTGKTPSKGYNVIELYFYFYDARNNNSLSVNGVMQMVDIDTNEGYVLRNGATNVYLTSGSNIFLGTLGTTTKYWLAKTNDDTNGIDRNHAMQITYSSTPSSPLHIGYYCEKKNSTRGMSFTQEGISVNYHAQSGKDWPSGANIPASIALASGANTAQGINSIKNNYNNVPGYTFSGWHLADGSVYNGSSCQTWNTDLYGYYVKQAGTVCVWKGIDGCTMDFLNSIPVENKTFKVRLYGTSTNGEWYDKTLDLAMSSTNYVEFTDVPMGTYTVEEVGYDSRYWTFTTGAQTVNLAGSRADVEIRNTVATGNLTVKKKLVNIEEGAISNAEDKKFKFTLYGTSGFNTTVNTTKELTGSGSVTFSGIPAGTYTLKESYYDGELWTPSAITQSVTIEKDVTKEVTVTNTFIPERTPQPAPTKSFDGKKGIEYKRIQKRSDLVTFSIFQQIKASDHEAVAPVKLAVKDTLDQAFDYKGYKAYVSTNAGTSWTDDTVSFTETINGRNVSLYKEKNSFSSAEWYRFDITVKVNDDIQLEDYIQNIDGTNFYVIPNTASTTFTYKSGTPNEVTQNTNTVTVRMPLDELNIEVKKSNEVTGENIANAEFTVYEWNGKDYAVKTGVMVYDGSDSKYKLLHIRKNDTNQGKFKIVETVTPWGHIGSWSKEVVIGTNATETYEATNPMGMGTITVLKKGKHNEVLSGAVYSIKAKENIVSPQGKVLVNAGTEVDKVTTGKDGKAVSKELYPGKYTVTETNAPLGYALNTAPQDVEVKYQDKDTKVTNSSVTFVNDRLYSVITVTKEIDTADIVWEHGNPTFTFKVDGKDALGNAHTYYETVEFTTANVGNGAKAALSAKFTVLAGTYTVSEEKTARYAFGSIHDVVSGTVSGQTAVLNVSGKKDGTETAGPSGAATFYNVKATDEDLTHTAFVKNTIA